MGDIYVYVHPTNGNWKVWGFDFYESTNGGSDRVIFFWGALGKPVGKLQSKDYEARDARYVAIDRCREKQEGGYYPIPRHIYQRLCDGEIGLPDFFIHYVHSVLQKDGSRGYGISTWDEYKGWFVLPKVQLKELVNG